MKKSESILFDSLTVDFDERFQLNCIDWTIADGQHWMIAGANGSGKSALAAVLAGYGNVVSGTLAGIPNSVSIVSFEAQAELIDTERKKDDADIMDVVSEGTPVRELLDQVAKNEVLTEKLISMFGLAGLLDRAFRKLSTGESRKVMLARALIAKPDLLVLDEPFEGLDAGTSEKLQRYLEDLSASTQIVLVLNRLEKCPAFITHFAYIENGSLKYRIDKADAKLYGEFQQLLHLKTADFAVPGADPVTRVPTLDPDKPLFSIKAGRIAYGDAVVFENLNWTIEPNQHWQLTGPNGSGKTCLLSLITGDHPQCYVNDIDVFGFKRGSGESIWQIKQFIGYVSTALQWEYTVATSLRNVIISGFYDSIGLYTRSTDTQKKIADEWLALLGMGDRRDSPFNKLSYGEQRLLLIARAMVKHPPLLILDEPCLGLDDMNRQLVLALIEKICSGGQTAVVYVNHHTEDKIAGIEHHLSLAGGSLNCKSSLNP